MKLSDLGITRCPTPLFPYTPPVRSMAGGAPEIEEEEAEEMSSDESPKQSTVCSEIVKEEIEIESTEVTTEVLAKAAVESKDAQSSPVGFPEEQEPKAKVDSKDVQLSPILFTQSKGTSPMSEGSQKPEMVDASVSPPAKLLHSASTSPPRRGDLESLKSSSPGQSSAASVSPGEPRPPIRGEMRTGSFEFEMEMDSSRDMEVPDETTADQPTEDTDDIDSAACAAPEKTETETAQVTYKSSDKDYEEVTRETTETSVTVAQDESCKDTFKGMEEQVVEVTTTISKEIIQETHEAADLDKVRQPGEARTVDLRLADKQEENPTEQIEAPTTLHEKHEHGQLPEIMTTMKTIFKTSAIAEAHHTIDDTENLKTLATSAVEEVEHVISGHEDLVAQSKEKEYEKDVKVSVVFEEEEEAKAVKTTEDAAVTQEVTMAESDFPSRQIVKDLMTSVTREEVEASSAIVVPGRDIQLDKSSTERLEEVELLLSDEDKSAKAKPVGTTESAADSQEVKITESDIPARQIVEDVMTSVTQDEVEASSAIMVVPGRDIQLDKSSTERLEEVEQLLLDEDISTISKDKTETSQDVSQKLKEREIHMESKPEPFSADADSVVDQKVDLAGHQVELESVSAAHTKLDIGHEEASAATSDVVFTVESSKIISKPIDDLDSDEENDILDQLGVEKVSKRSEDLPRDISGLSDSKSDQGLDEMLLVVVPPGGQLEEEDYTNVMTREDTEERKKALDTVSEEEESTGATLGSMTKTAVEEISVEAEDTDKASAELPKHQEHVENVKSQDQEQNVQIEVVDTKKEEVDILDEEIVALKEALDEEGESGLEIMSGEGKTFEEASMGTDQQISDRTDSLLKGSMHESFASDRTLSEPTLEAELATDQDVTVKDEDTEVVEVNIGVQSTATLGLEKVEKEEDITLSSLEQHGHLTEQHEDKKQESLESVPMDVTFESAFKETLGHEITEKESKVVLKLDEVEPEAKIESPDETHMTKLTSIERESSEEKSSAVTVQIAPMLSWSEHTAEESKTSEERSLVHTSQDPALDTKSYHWLIQDPDGSSSPSSSDVSKASKERMTSSSSERSGTQSSIESTSKTSEKSSSSSAYGAEEAKSQTSESKSEHESSELERSTSSKPSEDASQEEESLSEQSLVQSKARHASSGSDNGARAFSHRVTEIRTSATSSPTTSPTLKRGEVKVTSEQFSSDSDISKSLEIVYKQPEEDARRKMSEKYQQSTTSSSENSRPSSASKLEKRKPSVTQIQKKSESSESSSDHYELQHSKTLPEDDSGSERSVSPPTSKKTPSPTKIRSPAKVGDAAEQVTSEVISPVLEIDVQTPEQHGMSSTAAARHDDVSDKVSAGNTVKDPKCAVPLLGFDCYLSA